MQTSSGICLCATRNHISCTRKRSGHNSVSVVLVLARRTNLQELTRRLSRTSIHSHSWGRQHRTRRESVSTRYGKQSETYFQNIFHVKFICQLHFLRSKTNPLFVYFYRVRERERWEHCRLSGEARAHKPFIVIFLSYSLSFVFASVVSILSWSWQFAQNETNEADTLLRFLSLEQRESMCVCVAVNATEWVEPRNKNGKPKKIITRFAAGFHWNCIFRRFKLHLCSLTHNAACMRVSELCARVGARKSKGKNKHRQIINGCRILESTTECVHDGFGHYV